jgi:hypothetical protein
MMVRFESPTDPSGTGSIPKKSAPIESTGTSLTTSTAGRRAALPLPSYTRTEDQDDDVLYADAIHFHTEQVLVLVLCASKAVLSDLPESRSLALVRVQSHHSQKEKEKRVVGDCFEFPCLPRTAPDPKARFWCSGPLESRQPLHSLCVYSWRTDGLHDRSGDDLIHLGTPPSGGPRCETVAHLQSDFDAFWRVPCTPAGSGWVPVRTLVKCPAHVSWAAVADAIAHAHKLPPASSVASVLSPTLTLA